MNSWHERRQLQVSLGEFNSCGRTRRMQRRSGRHITNIDYMRAAAVEMNKRIAPVGATTILAFDKLLNR